MCDVALSTLTRPGNLPSAMRKVGMPNQHVAFLSQERTFQVAILVGVVVQALQKFVIVFGSVDSPFAMAAKQEIWCPVTAYEVLQFANPG